MIEVERYNSIDRVDDVAVCLTQFDTAHAFSLSTRPPTPPSPPPKPLKKVFGFSKISWVPFLKVGGFEPTETHP